MGKVVSPEETLRIIEKRIASHQPKILQSYKPIKKKSNIPQYLILGTDRYSELVNDIGRMGFSINSNGKGHIQKQALVSGLMELAERYSSCRYLLEREDVRKVSTFYENKHYGFEDFYSTPIYRDAAEIVSSDLVKDAKIYWHKVRDFDGNEVYLPLSLIFYVFQLTNGMTAGNTIEEALSHGVCEVIERHVKGLVREKKIRTPEIIKASIKSKIVKDLIRNFEDLGHEVLLKDYSLGIGIPSVGVIRKTGRDGYFVTIGTAPGPEEAAVRALIENSQIENKINKQSRKDVDFHYKESKNVAFSQLPDISSNDIKEELLEMKHLLESKGMKIYYADTTEESLGIPSAIVYITNAKRNSSEIGHRNILMGMVKESLRVGDLQQAEYFTSLGGTKDPRYTNYYKFYEAIISAKKGEYKKSVNILEKIKKEGLPKEFVQSLDICLGTSKYAIGDKIGAFTLFANTITNYPYIRYSALRRHHRPEKEISSEVERTFNQLQEKITQN